MSINLNCIETIKMLNNINKMIVVIDKNYKIVNASRQFYIITEYNENDILGQSLSSIISIDQNTIDKYNTLNLLNSVVRTKENKYIYAVIDELYFDIEHNIRFLLITRQAPQDIFNAIVLDSEEDEKDVICYIKDLNGNIVYTNRYFEDFFQIKEKDILGKGVRDLFKCEREDKFSRWFEEDDYIINTKESITTLESLIISDQIIYMKVKKKPVYNKCGTIIGVYCIIKDYTKEIMLKNDLMLKNEQLSIINDILGISDIDKLGCLLDYILDKLRIMFKISWISIYMYNESESKLEYLVSKGLSREYFSNYVETKKNMDMINHIFKNSLKVTELNNYTLDMYKKPNIEDENNNITHINSYQMVYNDKIIGLINYGSLSDTIEDVGECNFLEMVSNAIGCILNNILSKMLLEKNLKKEVKNNKQLDIFFNTSIDLLCIINNEGNFVRIGNQMLKDLGYEEEELINNPLVSIMHPDDIGIVNNLMMEKYQLKELCLRMLKTDGTYISIAWNTNYIEEEKIYICSGRNLTNEIILEQKKALAEKYIQIEKAKTEFLSNIEHELRTPIAIIDGSLKLITNSLKSSSNKQIHNYVESAMKNTYRMKRLINNIIEITNYDAMSIIPDKNYYNVVSIMMDIVASLNCYLDSYNVKINIYSKVYKYILYIDPLMLERVILNLVSNSVKYKKEKKAPKIEIRLFLKNDKLCIGVSDNGIGISAEEIPYLFERFCLINEVMTKKAEGSGMGLYIVKKLLETNNATIYVNEERKSGAEFIIEFADESSSDMPYIDKHYTVIPEHFDMEFSDIYF